MHSGNPIDDRPEGSKPTIVNGDFFPHARGVNVRDSTVINVGGNIYAFRSGEQSSLWNTYKWPEFDQQTLRDLPASSVIPAIRSIEMESYREQHTRLKVYRIHQYEDQEDIYDRHLAILKSSRLRRPDISQFLGTSVDNADGDRFIVLSGGGLSIVIAVRSHEDIEMVKVQCFFQILDMFGKGLFAPLDWSWPKFFELPMFSTESRLCLDPVLLESQGLIRMGKGRAVMIAYEEILQHQTTGNIQVILRHRGDFVEVRDIFRRAYVDFLPFPLLGLPGFGFLDDKPGFLGPLPFLLGPLGFLPLFGLKKLLLKLPKEEPKCGTLQGVSASGIEEVSDDASRHFSNNDAGLRDLASASPPKLTVSARRAAGAHDYAVKAPTALRPWLRAARCFMP